MGETPIRLAARGSSETTMATRECPFCGKSFRVLGRHVHACRERGEGPYAHLLANAKPTLVEQESESSSPELPSASSVKQAFGVLFKSPTSLQLYCPRCRIPLKQV